MSIGFVVFAVEFLLDFFHGMSSKVAAADTKGYSKGYSEGANDKHIGAIDENAGDTELA